MQKTKKTFSKKWLPSRSPETEENRTKQSRTQNIISTNKLDSLRESHEISALQVPIAHGCSRVSLKPGGSCSLCPIPIPMESGPGPTSKPQRRRKWFLLLTFTLLLSTLLLLITIFTSSMSPRYYRLYRAPVEMKSVPRFVEPEMKVSRTSTDPIPRLAYLISGSSDSGKWKSWRHQLLVSNIIILLSYQIPPEIDALSILQISFSLVFFEFRGQNTIILRYSYFWIDQFKIAFWRCISFFITAQSTACWIDCSKGRISRIEKEMKSACLKVRTLLVCNKE